MSRQKVTREGAAALLAALRASAPKSRPEHEPTADEIAEREVQNARLALEGHPLERLWFERAERPTARELSRTERIGSIIVLDGPWISVARQLADVVPREHFRRRAWQRLREIAVPGLAPRAMTGAGS